MKKGILFVLLSALAGGLTAYAVVKTVDDDQVRISQNIDGSMYRTVSLEHENWPDFTYAAESAVDAVVYVKVTSTASGQQQVPNLRLPSRHDSSAERESRKWLRCHYP